MNSLSNVPPEARVSRAQLLVIATAIAVFAGAYTNSLHNGFHFDDDHVIERNLFVRDLSNVPRFFTDPHTFSVFSQNATYRPLVSVTLAIDWALSGGESMVPFHVTQLLLLLGVAALLGWAIATLTGGKEGVWAGIFAATFFAVHTGNTQPGNYISARSELLSAIGVLGALLIYLRAPLLRRLQLHLVLMGLGALAKSPAVVFAPLLLVYKLIFEARLFAPREAGESGRLRRTVVAVLSGLPALVVGAAVFLFVEGMNPEGQTYGGGGRLQYLWTQASIWPRYLAMFFIPSGLTADTDLTLLPSWRDPRVFAGVALLVASLVGAAFAARRPSLRPVSFGIVWFWLGIAPTSSVFPLAEVTNDHRPFLGFLGLTVAAAHLIVVGLRALEARWSSQSANTLLPRAAAAIAVALIAGHAVGTHFRNRVWRNDESLWADVVQKSPLNGRGWMNYGLTQMSRGRYTEAKRLFDRAAELVPNYAVLEVNRGVLAGALKEPVAERHFLRAQQLDPNFPGAYSYFARWLLQSGRGMEAMVQLQTAVRLGGGDLLPRRQLMNLYAAVGRTEAAQSLAQETLAWGPDDVAQAHAKGIPPLSARGETAQDWYLLGWELTGRKDHVLAAQAYREAVRREPRHADAWNNLGWSLMELGFVNDAAISFGQALGIAPEHELAKNNLALARSRLLATSGQP